MNDKSHVGMGYSVCPVCCAKGNPTVLLNRQLKPTLERENFTGWEMCDACNKLKSEDYVACVGVTQHGSERMTLEAANRTGDVIHVHAACFQELFNEPAPIKGLCFISIETLDWIKGYTRYSMKGDSHGTVL